MNSRTIQILSVSLFALLLLWGTYTFIYYIGVPYHGAALLTSDIMKTATAGCDATAYLCRGMSTLAPFIFHTIGRASPFLWYGILSLLAYALFVAWQRFGSGQKTMRIVWAPWKILLLFVASTWLISTVLSFATVDGRPQRAYLEPTKDSYNVSEQALVSLQEDYQNLLGRGCLEYVGDVESGAKVYTLRIWCIETAFVTRVLTQVLFLVILLGELLILGRMVLKRLRYSPPTLLLETVFSVAAGAFVGIALLWFLAVAGLFVATAGWLLALAIPIVGFPHTRYWVLKFLHHRWTQEYRWYDISLVLGWLLISYLALNFLQVVRPFPIGWDDLGSYLNRPRMLVSYGRFISSMSAFDWSYLTSLGFLLFGFGSTVGATSSMMVNWSAGLLAVIGVFAFVRTFLGNRSGFLSALLYYSLPLVGHFSFADMKIDNAVFFFGAMATLAVLLAMLPRDEEESGHKNDKSWRLLLLAGIFSGIAFSTKSTAIMVILSLGALIIGTLLGSVAFVGILFLSFFLFTWMGVVSLQLIAARIMATIPPDFLGPMIIAVFFIVGMACLGWTLWQRRPSLLPTLTLIGAFGAGLALAILPWAEHNALEAGGIIPQPLAGAPNRISPKIDTSALPAELAIDRAKCQATGVNEELDRYWGFEKGWSHYLTLPWRVIMNLDATGYYVTMTPVLLLFPLLLLLPYFWSKQGRWLRWLFAATCMMLVQWMFLANGIPWYGVGILLGLVIGLEVLAQKAPDQPNRIITSILIGLSLLIAFGLRFWQFEQQRNLFEYSMGKISGAALEEITIPYYSGVSATVVDRNISIPDRPYLYRVGTFIPYFIPKNLEIIGINDHQLDVFNCLYQERDGALTTRRLKALKFNSIIFDTNTATIERDENGSLHKKVNAFVDYVNNPASGLQILVSDTNAGIAFILIP